jgi:hypothetical protein
MITHRLTSAQITALAVAWSEETPLPPDTDLTPFSRGISLGTFIILFGHNDSANALEFYQWIESTYSCTVCAGPSQSHADLIFADEKHATAFLLRWA